MRVDDIPEIDSMSTPEKILFVEELWDKILNDESGIPVPQSHKDELDKRLRQYRAQPGNLLSLEELQGRIAQRK